MHWLQRFLFWSLATGLACLATTRGEAGPAGESKQVREIRQGNYVEKVQPGVDYKDRMPRTPPRSPAGSLKALHVLPGMRVELVAAEPLVRDPVDLTFDENGRLYVAELTTYSENRATRSGRISLLEDVDGDGRFDKSTPFAEGLEWPTGLACFDGGLFVASTPDLYYFKDTDGDGRADVRELVITGFSTSNPNQCANSLRWTLDDRIELMPSGGGGLLRSLRWKEQGDKPIQVRGRDISFEPRTGQLRLESGGAQYGMTFDVWGRKFESSNSAPIQMIMFEDRYIARNPYLAAPSSRLKIWVDGNAVYRTSPVEPWRIIRTEMRIRGIFSGPVEGGGRPDGYFTSACGVTIHVGNAWPEPVAGNAFVGEGASNLVHRMRLQPDGVAMKARRVDKESEFLTSDEIWFRPVQFANAPDGTLYIADMYREVYEHPDAIPPSVKKYLDINAGNDRGRIYRVVPEGFRQPPPVHLGSLSTPELVKLLAHPNGWHRRTASRLLYERQDEAAIEPLRQMATRSPSPLGRMHALYALAGQQALEPDVILAALHDTHPRVREHAVRLSERILADWPAVRARLYEMASDGDIRVRYQLAFTLGNIHGQQATAALAQIARRDVGDRWIQLAVLSSSLGRAGTLLALLGKDRQWRQKAAARSFLASLAQQAGREDRADQVAEVVSWLDSCGPEEKELAQAVVRGLSQGLAKAGSPLRTRLSSKSGARARQLLGDLIATARKVAADENRPTDKRAEAIRSLALAPFDQVRRLLASMLVGQQPQAVQMAALQTLSRFQDDQVAPIIVQAWKGFSPQVRGEAAEALLARPARLTVLLKALEQGTIAPSQLAPARIQFLLEHPDPAIRREAQRLLGGAKLARRQDVVAEYQDVLKMQGDVQRGRDVFRRECASCHRLEGVGQDLGLPLQNIKNRGPDGILLNVLDPNRQVDPNYLNYTVITTDGRMITGVITAETATSITLTRAEGESDTVLRAEIDELRCSDLSIMPEGLEQKISKQEMADLIAYLMVVQ